MRRRGTRCRVSALITAHPRAVVPYLLALALGGPRLDFLGRDSVVVAGPGL